MTPILSLLVLCGLIAVLTIWQGTKKITTTRGGAVRHLLLCGLMALPVWLFNGLLWPQWSDGAAVLTLLLLESVALGLLSTALLYSSVFSLQIPARAIKRPQPARRPQTKPEREDSGVVHLRRFRETKGVLPGGVLLIWDEEQGRWVSQGFTLMDDPNAIAS